MKEIMNIPTIYRLSGTSGIWACMVRGARSGLGAGPTPQVAYEQWVKVIANNARNAF
jgi:hypothetical protein